MQSVSSRPLANDTRNWHGKFSRVELELEQFTTMQANRDWREIWELYYTHPWFRNKLRYCVRKAARNSGLNSDCHEDIQQEVLIEFATTLQRNRSLGFDPSKGSILSFLSTIIYRWSLRGTRQFEKRHYSLPVGDALHQCYEVHSSLEDLIDFRLVARQIPEPYRGIIRQLTLGETVSQIAKIRNLSKRTVYRRINRLIELMKSRVQ